MSEQQFLRGMIRYHERSAAYDRFEATRSEDNDLVYRREVKYHEKEAERLRQEVYRLEHQDGR
jgi:hypothetical protein